MSMAKGTGVHQSSESPIFENVSLYKVIKTNKGRTVMLHSDGSVSMIIPFEGINNTSLTEEDYVSMFRRIQSTLDDVDSGDMSIQFMMVRDNKVGSPVKDHLPSFLKPRADYLDYLAENYMLFVNRFYLSIHCQALTKGTEGVLTRLYKKFKHRNDHTYQYEKVMSGIENRVTKVVELADAMCQMLTDIGASFRLIKEEQDYYRILQEFTRPSKSKDSPVFIDNGDLETSPRTQIFSGVRASVTKYDFSLDDYYHKVWTLDRSPRETIFGKTIEAIETVPFEFIYSVTFRTATTQESLSTFKMKLAEKRMASGGNQGALVEDRTLMAEEKRVSESYDRFAFGDARGLVISANFVLRAKEEFIEKMCRAAKVTREEMIRRFDQNLTKRVFSRFGASEWVNEEGTGFPVFSNIIPGMSSMYNGVLKTLFLTTENIPYFLALYDNKRNLDHNGTNHFIDARGNRVVFDLMDPSLPAWNYSISGQTGSGKSVLVNALLTMQFADTARGKRPVICILDVGGDRGSYTKFMELVKGTQINLSRTMKPSIQMFELIPDRSVPTPAKIRNVAKDLYQDMKKDEELSEALDKYESVEKLEMKVREYYNEKLGMPVEMLSVDYEMKKLFMEIFNFAEKPKYREMMALHAGEVVPDQKRFNLIMGVLEVVLSTSSKKLDGFDTYDYDEISEIVMETYRRIGEKHKRYPYMSDFLDVAGAMVKQNEPMARKMLTKIKNYTKEGAYPMFDQDTNIDTTNDVILTDLKGLEAEPQLQMIYTLLISQLYNDKMYFVKDRRKLIVRDEAWSLMQNERARRYFVEDLRTARKNGFATIAISQLPTDYLQPNPADGRAIISNFQVNIFCKFSTDSICREVGQEYNLGPEIVEEMKSLGVQKEIQEDGSFKPTYAKFMMVMGKSVYILKNLLHPFEYALYSSSAEDNAIIDYYMRVTKTYSNLEDVLWVIAQNKHIGDNDLATFLDEAGYKNMARRVRRQK
jgi:hypothetical protein